MGGGGVNNHKLRTTAMQPLPPTPLCMPSAEGHGGPTDRSVQLSASSLWWHLAGDRKATNLESDKPILSSLSLAFWPQTIFPDLHQAKLAGACLLRSPRPAHKLAASPTPPCPAFHSPRLWDLSYCGLPTPAK